MRLDRLYQLQFRLDSSSKVQLLYYRRPGIFSGRVDGTKRTKGKLFVGFFAREGGNEISKAYAIVAHPFVGLAGSK